MAFQLIDDEADLLVSPQAAGKPVNNDLKNVCLLLRYTSSFVFLLLSLFFRLPLSSFACISSFACLSSFVSLLLSLFFSSDALHLCVFFCLFLLLTVSSCVSVGVWRSYEVSPHYFLLAVSFCFSLFLFLFNVSPFECMLFSVSLLYCLLLTLSPLLAFFFFAVSSLLSLLLCLFFDGFLLWCLLFTKSSLVSLFLIVS